MTLEDKVHAFRFHALQRAHRLGNVSAACRELGISRTVFYRWKNRFDRYGPDGLHPRRRSARPGRPPSLSLNDEQAVVAVALAYPGCGPHQYAARLRMAGRDLSPSTVYRALRRAGLRTRHDRLLVLERHSAKQAGLLTERTRRHLRLEADRQTHTERNRVPRRAIGAAINCIPLTTPSPSTEATPQGGGEVWLHSREQRGEVDEPGVLEMGCSAPAGLPHCPPPACRLVN